jgi:uncharacterized protein DUF6285
MNDHPNALALLRIAHQTLLDNVLPDAKPEQVYALRMIANAIGIATREMENHADHATTEARSMAALYNEAMTPGRETENNRKLARDIRSGAFEANAQQHAALFAHLRATTRHKLQVAHPRALQGDIKNNQ